ERNIPSSPTTGSRSPPRDTLAFEKDVKRLRRDIAAISDFFDQISPFLSRRVNRIVDAGLSKAHQSDLYEHHIELLTEIGGVLTVNDTNPAIENRKLDEMEKNKRRIERERERAREREAREMAQQQSLQAIQEPIDESAVSYLPDSSLLFIDIEGEARL
ncbi:hypothetical protein TSTA_033350, partial [Talaromyces stipitatus ATCC 10500]